MAIRAAYSSTRSLFIPGNDNSAIQPGGDGFGTVTVTVFGNVTIDGMLGDGTKISQTAALSKDGEWPFYLFLLAERPRASS